MAYTNAIFYLDYENGSDAARTTLSGVAFTNSSGLVNAYYVGHGLITGAVVTVASSTSYNAAWKITRVDDDNFTLDTSTYIDDRTGTVTPFGGSSWTDAWKTFTSGATAARIAPGDTVRASKTSAPVSIGSGSWRSRSDFSNGTITAKTPISSSNASPIQMNVTAHGYSTGDIVMVYDHTVNTSANGLWTITKVDDNNFTLDDSVGVGTGGATGKVKNISYRVVKMDTDQVLMVDDCDTLWTAANSATTALNGNTYNKQGLYCTKITPPSSVPTSTLYAYRDLGTTLDLSSYQKLSFWFYNYYVAAANDVWRVCLCSDTSGAVVVDTFIIPAIPSVSANIPITLTRSGGGNLGSSIQSIAVYSGTAAPTATRYIFLDNIIACTTDGIHLGSVISKSSSEVTTDEGWYGIKSIKGKYILLDNETNCASLYGAGYYGTSETCTTYKRECWKMAYQYDDTTSEMRVMDSGSLAGGNISFLGGWNKSTNLQDGETFIDQGNGRGRGIYSTGTSYVTVDGFSYVRCGCIWLTNTSYWNMTVRSACCFNGHLDLRGTNNTLSHVYSVNNSLNYGLYLYGSWNVGTIHHACGSSYNIYLEGLYNSTIDHIGDTCSAGNYNLYFTGCYDVYIGDIGKIDLAGITGLYLITCRSITIDSIDTVDGCGTTGIYQNTCYNNKFGTINSCSGNSSYNIHLKNSNGCYIKEITDIINSETCLSLDTASNNIINKCSISGATIYPILMVGGINYINNLTLVGLIYYDSPYYYNITRLLINNLNGDPYTNKIYRYGCKTYSQSDTRHTESGIAWRMNFTSTYRSSVSPEEIIIAKVACNANKTITVSAWFKKDHATNVAAQLLCKRYQIAGVDDDVYDTKTDDTDWEQLTISFTPTENGVVEIMASAYCTSITNADVYIDDITISST